MGVKRLYQAGFAGMGLAVVAAGIALAAAPVPQGGKAYDSFKKGLGLTYVTSVANPRRILPGPAQPPLGSQFALSVGSIQCLKAKRNPGLPKSDKPIALFSFPGALFKLTHGKYSFSVSKTVRKESIAGSPAKPFKLAVKFTGTVTNTKTIAGRVSVHGGPCTVRKPIPYRAKLDKKAAVGPQ